MYDSLLIFIVANRVVINELADFVINCNVNLSYQLGHLAIHLIDIWTASNTDDK
jgi:hypothetical protein